MNHREAVIERLRAINPVPDEQSPPSGAIEAAFVKAQIERDQAPMIPDQAVWRPRLSWRRPALVVVAAFLVVLLVGGFLAFGPLGGGRDRPVPPATEIPDTSIELSIDEGEAQIAAAVESVGQALPSEWVSAASARPARGIVDFQACYEQPELGIDRDPSLDLADLSDQLVASGMVTLNDSAARSALVTLEALAFAEEAEATRVQGALEQLLDTGRNRICVAVVAFPEFGADGVEWAIELDDPPTRALSVANADHAMALGGSLVDGPFAEERAVGAVAVRRSGNLVYILTLRDVAGAVDVGVIDAVFGAI